MAFLQSSWIILFSDKLIAKPEIAIVYAWNQSTMVCIFLLTHEMSYDFKGMRNITFAYTKLFFFGLEIMKKKRLQVLLQFFLSKIVILSGTFLTFMKFKELINSAKNFSRENQNYIFDSADSNKFFVQIDWQIQKSFETSFNSLILYSTSISQSVCKSGSKQTTCLLIGVPFFIMIV